MKEERIGPMLFIPGDNRGRYPFCNSLYLEGKTRVIIDPSSNRETLLGLRDSPGVDAVLLSHYHEDHFMHLDLFEDRGLWMSEEDSAAMEDMEKLLDCYNTEDKGEREKWKQILAEMFHFRARKAGRILKDGEVVSLGGVTLEIIEAPGHTPGSLSLFIREAEALFLGDYDLSPFGPWYGDKNSDIDATIAAIGRLRRIPAKLWIVSHEKGIFRSQPGILWDQYLAVIDRREEMLYEFLKEPRSMDEIIDRHIVYKKAREPREFYDFGEKAIMGKHLERLISRGMALKEDGKYIRV